MSDEPWSPRDPEGAVAAENIPMRMVFTAKADVGIEPDGSLVNYL